jgi:predicted RNA binding protein YcfA (HicA-like mRNA interferase family)
VINVAFAELTPPMPRPMMRHRTGMPRKIRQLVADLESAGFMQVAGGKGSHRKFRHPKFGGAVILGGHDGDDARQYQEKQVRHAIREVQQ